MNRFLVRVFCYLVILIFSPALEGAAALPPEEAITKATAANKPVSFSFGADDNYTDVIVHVTMQAVCELKITRIPVYANDIQTRCGGKFHPSVLVMETNQPAPGGQLHASIYKIEPVGVCAAEAFPARIDISYFGKFEKTGPNNKVFRLRMVHEPSDGSDCRDITIGVHKLPNDPDPKGSGGEGGGFSNFFLLNLHDSHLPDAGKIEKNYDELIALTMQHIQNQEQVLKDAKKAFQDGVTGDSRPKFEEAIQKLKGAKAAVDNARTAGTLTAGKAKGIQAAIPQLIFAVQQFAAARGIDIPL